MSRILQYSLKLSLLKFSRHAISVQNRIVRPLLPCGNYGNYCISKYNYSTTSSNNLEKIIGKLDDNARRLGRLSLKEVEHALKEVKSSRSITVTQSLMMIRCCGSLLSGEKSEKRLELVENVWNTLKNLGINFDISHYNALLRVYVENEHQFSPTDILAEVKQKGLEPNRVTCQRLITKYCQSGDIAGATHILEYMREKDMPINVSVFNALILGHCRANDMESAEGILTVMKDTGVEPSSETYALLTCGYIQQGNFERVEELIRLCETKDIALSNTDYFDMIYACAIHGHENEVDKFLDRMRKTLNYNHDAFNFTRKLVLADKAEIAYKVLKSMNRSTRPDGSWLPVGNFFISQMVAADQPTDLLLKYCSELVRENLNPNAVNIALECSLRYGKESTALTLMNVAKENGIPIRHHYFWPLLVQRGKKNDVVGILDILTTMNKQYGLVPNAQTIREYVVPFMYNEKVNIDKILLDLKSCGVSISTAVSSVVIHLLNKKKIMKAAEVAESFAAFYPLYIIRRPLVASFLATKDVDSFIKILKEVSIGLHWKSTNQDQERTEEDDTNVSDYRNPIGSIVGDAVRDLLQDKKHAVLAEKIIQQLFANGIGISSKSAEYIGNLLKDELQTPSLTVLQKLTSEEYAAPPVKHRNQKLLLSSVSEKSLERLQETMDAKGRSTVGIKRHLFLIASRDKDLEKMQALKTELEAENAFSDGLNAVLMDTLAAVDRYEEAVELYRKVCEKNPEFTLDRAKTLRLANAFVQREQYDEAMEVLKKKSDSTEVMDKPEENVFLNVLCWKLLSTLAANGQVEKVKEVFDVLLHGNFTEVHTMLLGPLIKVHAKRDDWESALNEFQNCVEKYTLTPWKNELIKHFIEKEDAASLQKITDLSTKVHGERNSLCDLALLLMECGRSKQAKKILETPGVRMNQDRLQLACRKYVKEKSEEYLRSFLELTKDMNFVDRSIIYDSLLSVYVEANDFEKASALWTQMQEEDVPPSDAFLVRLAGLLKNNNIPVPFTVPQLLKPQVKSTVEPRIKPPFKSNVKNMIEVDGIDKALEQVLSTNVSKLEWSLVVDACVKNDRYSDAKKVFEKNYFASSKMLPRLDISRRFLIAARKAGDVGLFENFSKKIAQELRARLSFDNLWAGAYLSSNRVDELLTNLEHGLSKAQTDEELKSYLTAFPRGTILEIGFEKPEYVTRIEALLEKCMEKCDKDKDVTVANVLWMLNLIRKNDEKANELWNKYLKDYPGFILFKGVLKFARKTGDVEIATKLANFMETKCADNSNGSTVANAFLISIYVQNGQVEEALKRLEYVLTKTPIETLSRNVLIELENACQDKNIQFPYKIPPSKQSANISSDSSESDSD